MLGITNQIFKKLVYTGILASILLAGTAGKAISAPDSNSIVIDDIEFYVETDKSIYYLGENVQMLYRLTKLGFPSVTIPCNRSPELNLVVRKDGETIWMMNRFWYWYSPGLELLPCIPCELAADWDMNDLNDVPVGPGTYDVLGVIYSGIGLPDVGVRITILPEPRTITVGLGAGYDFNTIQAAIDDAYDGDTITVADGTYTGDGNRDIDFLGKAITLRSENGPENCIIDCNGTLAEKHRGFYFHSGEEHNSAVGGFTITNGHAERGGAIFCVSSSPTLTNCIFRDSTAKYWSQSIASTPLGDTKTMVNDGNGVHIMIPPPDPQWRGDGGGITCFSSSPLLKNCKFIGNWAYEEGGGMLNYRSSPTLINCTFTGNSASIGGGIANWISCRPTLVNCTFTSNSSTNGNAISCDSMNNNFPNVLEVTNCILYDDGDEIRNNDGSTIIITYSAVQGGWQGLGNIDVDPCFANVNNGDYHLKSQAGRWEPASESWVQDDVTSPCIDAGNPGCSLGDEPAPNGNRRNMGAYGGTTEASKSPDNWRSIADLTNDWILDSNDLKVFVGYWLEAGECIPSDLDRNKFVDFNDFALFSGSWPEFVVNTDCLPDTLPEYPLWVTLGKPECWCYPRQCHGDVDGLCTFGICVSLSDVSAFNSAYYHCSDYYMFVCECIDFNRDGRVDYIDRSIIEYWALRPDVPADCGGNLEPYGQLYQISENWLEANNP